MSVRPRHSQLLAPFCRTHICTVQYNGAYRVLMAAQSAVCTMCKAEGLHSQAPSVSSGSDIVIGEVITLPTVQVYN